MSCRVDDTHLGALLERLGTAGITGLVSRPPTLEELFLGYYGDAGEAAHAGAGGGAQAAGDTDATRVRGGEEPG